MGQVVLSLFGVRRSRVTVISAGARAPVSNILDTRGDPFPEGTRVLSSDATCGRCPTSTWWCAAHDRPRSEGVRPPGPYAVPSNTSTVWRGRPGWQRRRCRSSIPSRVAERSSGEAEPSRPAAPVRPGGRRSEHAHANPVHDGLQPVPEPQPAHHAMDDRLDGALRIVEPGADLSNGGAGSEVAEHLDLAR